MSVADSSAAHAAGSTMPVAIWLLRGALACRGIGLGIKFLWHPFETESDLFETVVFDWQWPETWAQRLDDNCMGLYAMGGVSLLIINALRYRRTDDYQVARGWRRAERLFLSFCVFWELALAAAATYRGGAALSELTLAARAMRIAVPMVLAGVSRRGQLTDYHVQGLVWATAATFVTHGCEAMLRLPAFTTMILATASRLGGWDLSQATAEYLLQGIGLVDVAVALLLLSTGWRWVPWYMAGWGLITAIARATGSGPHDVAETLLRGSHFAIPLVLALRRASSDD